MVVVDVPCARDPAVALSGHRRPPLLIPLSIATGSDARGGALLASLSTSSRLWADRGWPTPRPPVARDDSQWSISGMRSCESLLRYRLGDSKYGAGGLLGEVLSSIRFTDRLQVESMGAYLAPHN